MQTYPYRTFYEMRVKGTIVPAGTRVRIIELPLPYPRVGYESSPYGGMPGPDLEGQLCAFETESGLRFCGGPAVIPLNE